MTNITLQINCPNDHGPMTMTKKQCTTTIKGEELQYKSEFYFCAECKIEIATPDQAQKSLDIVNHIFKYKHGLLSSQKIIETRHQLNLSQDQFAKKLTVGVASVKRWELGAIQNSSMDKLIRILRDNPTNYNGNRQLSFARTKLVLIQFSIHLKRQILKGDNKALKTAKNLWYADMCSFNLLGKSMTGNTYAALPKGPQLDNYDELLTLICNANKNDCEPLSENEIFIISKIAETFPDEWDAFHASHKEPIWKKTSTGHKINYHLAGKLEQIKIDL